MTNLWEKFTDLLLNKVSTKKDTTSREKKVSIMGVTGKVW